MSKTTNPLERMKQDCDLLSEVENDTNRLAARLWKISINYFELVLGQAQRSFRSASVAALIGIILFSAALTLMMMGHLSFSKLSLVAGVNIQVFSAIGFYLYAKTSQQFAAFHVCLERANRFLLANTMCDEIEDTNKKDETRKKLIGIIATAPLLSFDVVEHGGPNIDLEQPSSPKKEGSGPPVTTTAQTP